MNNLVNSIANGVWMIQPDYVHANMHLIERILTGQKFVFERDLHPTESTITVDPIMNFSYVNVTSNTDFGMVPQGSVAVISLKGVLMKDDQYCGPQGMVSKNNMLKRALASDNIDAIVLDTDTPGGQATYTDTFAKSIREATEKKPVVTFFSSLNCSAGYYLTMASSEIYASEKTDTVGSVGTLIGLRDYTGFFEKKGIKVHEIYAPQSTLKNKKFKDALNGNYAPIQETILKPTAQQFIDRVNEYRPSVNHADALKGETYMADEAVKIGMIDGIKTFDEVILRAKELANQSNYKSNSNNSTMDASTFPSLNALLGVDELVIDKADNTSTLQVGQLETIEAALTELATLKNDHQEATGAVSDAKDTIAAANQAIADLKQSLADLKNENNSLKDENATLGGEATDSTKVDTTKDNVDAELDEMEKLAKSCNDKIAASLPSILQG